MRGRRRPIYKDTISFIRNSINISTANGGGKVATVCCYKVVTRKTIRRVDPSHGRQPSYNRDRKKLCVCMCARARVRVYTYTNSPLSVPRVHINYTAMSDDIFVTVFAGSRRRALI